MLVVTLSSAYRRLSEALLVGSCLLLLAASHLTRGEDAAQCGAGLPAGATLAVSPTSVAAPGSGSLPDKVGPGQAGSAGLKPAVTRRVIETYGKLPLSFEANQGQTDPQVKFLSRGRGYTLFLTDGEAVLALRSRQSSVVSSQSQRANDQGPRTADRFPPLSIGNPQSATDTPSSPARSVLRLRLVGANPQANVTGLHALPGKSNYFLGNDPTKWRTNVPHYAKVKYGDVYPGIDLVYYGNQGRLEYDFVVASGADPRAISLAIETRNPKIQNGRAKTQYPKPKIAANGDLVISTEAGEIRFHKPVVYQTQSTLESRLLTVASGRTTDDGPRTTNNPPSPIDNLQFLDGRYVLLAGNRIRFEVGAYDRSKPLVIDPTLSFSTYLGGSSYDKGNAVAVDSSGNVYVTGATSSADFPLANALYGTCTNCSFPNITDAFVAKLNAAGSQLLYSTYLGGSDLDEARGISVDPANNIYLTGLTFSNDFPTQAAYQAVYGGGGDVFVTKINADGTALLYSTYLGGNCLDEASATALDGTGIAFVTGNTCSDAFPTTTLSYQPTRPPSGASVTDAFMAKVDTTQSGVASLLYSTFLGGTDNDAGNGIALDTSGNVYVVGQTSSSDFPTTPGAFDSGCGTDNACDGGAFSDAFVAKLDTSQSGAAGLVYSTFLGGGDSEKANAVALDTLGNAYVTGFTKSPDFRTTTGALQTTQSAPGFEAFVTKLNATGSTLVYSTYLGGAGFDEGRAITVDSSQNAYIAGATISTDFPVASPIQATCRGCPTSGDAFVAKLNAAGSALVFSSYLGGTQDDSGDAIALDSSANAYFTGATQSDDFFLASALYPTFGGGTCGTDPFGNPIPCTEAFVAKLTNLALPVVTLSTPYVTFPDQTVGTASTAQTVTLTNNGDASLTLAIATTGDFDQSSTCGSSLAAAASCDINVTFAPLPTGARTGKLILTDNAYGSPHEVALSGRGVSAASVYLSTPSVSFGNQRVHTTSAAHTVTLTNNGTGLMNISGISSSLPAIFPETHTCLSTLAPAASCTISVTFAPAATGASAGVITISDDAAGNPHVVSLSGTGVEPAASLAPTSLTFTDQKVGTTSAAQTVTLTNSGTSALTISSIAASGDFAQTNTCPVSPATLAAGANCTISVTFTPTTTETRRGSVTVTDDASGSPHTVPLEGIGVAPRVTFSPASLSFASQPVGTTSGPQTVTLTNSGRTALTISSIAAGGDFAQTNDCPVAPASLAVGAQCTFTISFMPTSTDVRRGSVTIVDDAPGSPHSIGLSGLGADYSISLSPTSATVDAGKTATFTLTVTPAGGFSQLISLSCQGAPQASKCEISPSSVTPNGTGPATATVTVTTSARSVAAPRLRVAPPPIGSHKGLPILLGLLALMMLTPLVARRRAWVALSATLFLGMLWAACGGGGEAQIRPPTGTPAGSYTLTITAASGTLSHSTALRLTVN